MLIDESFEQYEEMQLFYDVMEIGLAVMGPAGESDFFQFIDNALDTFNLIEMRVIKEAFVALSPSERSALLEGDVANEQAATALTKLLANCRALGRQVDIKIA